MSVALRRALLVLSHLLAAALGFGIIAADRGRDVAVTMLGAPERRLGAAMLSVMEQPTSEHAVQALDALSAAHDQLAPPVESVVRLRLLAIAARASGDDGDMRQAIDACIARGWPQCDRESVRAMGAVK